MMTANEILIVEAIKYNTTTVVDGCHLYAGIEEVRAMAAVCGVETKEEQDEALNSLWKKRIIRMELGNPGDVEDKEALFQDEYEDYYTSVSTC